MYYPIVVITCINPTFEMTRNPTSVMGWMMSRKMVLE